MFEEDDECDNAPKHDAYPRDVNVNPFANINHAEMGEDTRLLLGIKAGDNGNKNGSSGTKNTGEIPAERKRHDRTVVKQMDYNEIKILERIGKGSYGEVFQGTWRGTEVAIKKLPYYFNQMEDREQQRTFLTGFIQETQLMKYVCFELYPQS